jgi:hypothetical protein
VENTEIAEDEVKLVVEGAYDIAGEASVVHRVCVQSALPATIETLP